ncbi:MAG TPA: hypothetical protein VFC67_24185 [Prolixibacteraceae bacterium]|nr:hypothetical protein [Prolixibacteraceae bacterium]
MKNEELDYIIEESFRTEPDIRLPADFARKLTLSVTRREQWKTDVREYLYLTAVLISLLAVATLTYYLIDKDIVIRFFSFITQNAVTVVFIVFILNFILFADRVLLRLLFNRWKRAS